LQDVEKNVDKGTPNATAPPSSSRWKKHRPGLNKAKPFMKAKQFRAAAIVGAHFEDASSPGGLGHDTNEGDSGAGADSGSVDGGRGMAILEWPGRLGGASGNVCSTGSRGRGDNSVSVQKDEIIMRYSVATYTDGPATRWNVIDHSTQEWVRRFASETNAKEYAAKLEAKALNREG
jgi:hypothetical protein